MVDLSKNEVVEFYIEMGSRGCFHRENLKRSYINKKDRFVVDQSTSNNDFLTKAPNHINKEKIHRLVSAIDSSRFISVSLTDLQLTHEDIANFKKFIDSEEQRIKENEVEFFGDENLYAFPDAETDTDFAFYKKVADSLMTLPVELVNQVFWNASEIVCTTTNWRTITFVFKDKSKLIVKNSDYIPNYLYVPWAVNYEGVEFKSNSIVFGQLMHQLVGSEFFGKTGEKNYAIFRIADYLYRAQWKDK